jgi:hypothetical protein
MYVLYNSESLSQYIYVLWEIQRSGVQIKGNMYSKNPAGGKRQREAVVFSARRTIMELKT